MMTLDWTGDLATLRLLPPFEAGDEAAYLAALRMVGGRDEPYVLLTIFAGAGALTQAGEREQALWYKATRERMNRTCRALAIVRPGADEAMAARFRRLWSFPLLATEDEAGARRFLLEHLS